MSTQIPLKLSINQEQRLDNFVFSEENSSLKFCLAQFDSYSDISLFLYGSSGTGKTHLLNAICSSLLEVGKTAMYLPLSDELSFSAFNNLYHVDCVCIDDLEYISGDRNKQVKLFNLYNEIREHNKIIVIASAKSLDSLDLLPDLKTRIFWGQSYAIYQVNDLDKIQLLQNITSDLGINLTVNCINYLLNHYSRDVKKLISLIKELDIIAVSKKKKISIPIIKSVID